MNRISTVLQPLPNDSTVDVPVVDHVQEVYKLKRLWTMLLDGRVVLIDPEGSTRCKGHHNPLRRWFFDTYYGTDRPWWSTDLGWDDEVLRMALNLIGTLSLEMLQRPAGDVFLNATRPRDSLLALTVWFDLPVLFEALVDRGLDPREATGGPVSVLKWLNQRVEQQPSVVTWKRWAAHYEQDSLARLAMHDQEKARRDGQHGVTSLFTDRSLRARL